MKNILITGGSSGIGAATAQLCIEKGHRVHLMGRNAAQLAIIQQNLGNQCTYSIGDVRKIEDCQSTYQDACISMGQVDVLINNAGLASGFGPIQDGDFEDWDRMMDTNVKGLLNVSKMIMPGMVERKSGHIINIASIAGKEAYPNGNIYCASKHAVDAISKTMRIDLLPHGIRVTNIAPGMAETEFSLVRYHGDTSKASKVYKGIEPLHGKDIAEVVYFAAALPENINLNDIVITPRFQANATQAIRKD
jgi:hypothetical protein